MAMRKKWSRLIAVDGVRYRYHVAEDTADRLRLNVCVQQVGPAGQRLMTAFRKPMTWDESVPGQRSGQVVPHAVTPRLIRQLILTALAQGWRPAGTGLAAFLLPASEAPAL